MILSLSCLWIYLPLTIEFDLLGTLDTKEPMGIKGARLGNALSSTMLVSSLRGRLTGPPLSLGPQVARVTCLALLCTHDSGLSEDSLHWASHHSVFSFQVYAKDMVTDFDEKHDEYLILLQQRNR